ncbi:TRAP transporter substrate-binding protein DctP [Desulfomicrobium salsuginis]
MKKALWTLVTLTLLLAGAAQAAEWKLAHVRPQGAAIDVDLNRFADEVNAATGGKIAVKIYPASALGDYTVVQERIGVGAVEMACQPAATAADKRFQILFFPYLVKDYAQAKKNFSGDTPLRKEIAALYEKQGISVLAAWPVYFGGISLNKEPKAPGDPDVAQGLKVRVPPMKTFQLLAENTGFMATPMPFSEVFTAVQTGVVDGIIGSGAEGYYASFRDVTKYYLPTNTHFEVWYLIMNSELLAGLDDAERAKLLDVAKQFEDRRWETVEADQKKNEAKLAENGAKIVAVTPEQIAKTATIAEQKVWPEILKDVGEDWGKAFLAKIAE